MKKELRKMHTDRLFFEFINENIFKERYNKVIKIKKKVGIFLWI